MRTTLSPELLATAAHEIGHAVVNQAGGLGLDHVRVAGIGAGNCRPANFAETDVAKIRAYAVGCLAGYEAELRWCDRHGPGRPERASARGDLREFRRAATDLRRFGVRLSEHQARTEARRLVARHWGQITRLTPKLARAGRLTSL